MTSASQANQTQSTYRVDLPCDQAGFGTPPFDMRLVVLPSEPHGGGWTLLAHSAPGKSATLARWLARHVPVTDVLIAPGLAPKVFRAAMAVLPPAWSAVASRVKVHNLVLAADGHAVWFVEGTRDEVWALAEHLEATQEGDGAPGAIRTGIRCRAVRGWGREATLSRRQSEALCTAVAMGYYEIPHRIDLRALAKASGVSLGSVSELLRRAEGAIITHYVDSNLMGWPTSEEGDVRSLRSLMQHEAFGAPSRDPSVRLAAPGFGLGPTPTPAWWAPRGPPR